MGAEAGPEDPILYRYRFGTAEFNEASFELRVAGLAVEVQRKPLELLNALLRHAGEVVTKEELLDTVWAGVITVENVVPNAMTKLRNALGPENGAAIATQQRVGYRLMAPVERVAIGRSLVSALALAAGQAVPRRENFLLAALIGKSLGNEVWTARHRKTGEVRVYKFNLNGQHLAALKREARLARVLSEGLGPRQDLVRVIDWNLETPPFFLECEFGGEALGRWAETAGRLAAMAPAGRLELFLQIAEAVAAAHSVGVLHTDLKPANILVAPAGAGWQIRVADFGSGRLLDPDRLAALGISMPGLTPIQDMADGSGSTPLYVAPEVTAGQMPTVLSDVYALGLILYQMMAGDLDKLIVPGWERDIEDELLREDIAAATDGDPARRPEGAAALVKLLRTLADRRAERIRRLAVEAAARTAMAALNRHRARRPWIRATIAVLAAGLVASLALSLQLRRSQQALATELAVANGLDRFLTDDFIGAADASVTGRTDITVAQAAKAAVDKIDTTVKDGPPEYRAALHLAMEQAFRNLGDFPAVLTEGARAVEAIQAEPATDQFRLAAARLAMADASMMLGRLDDAAALLALVAPSLDDRTALGREIEVRYWWQKSMLATSGLDLREGLADARRSWALVQRLRDPSSDSSEQIQLNLAELADQIQLSLADVERLSENYVESERLFRDLVTRQTAAYGEGDPRPNYATVGLAADLGYEERYDEAIGLLQAAVPRLEHRLGPDHYYTYSAKSFLAGLYFQLERFEEAERLWEEAVTATARREGETSVSYLTIEHNIARSRHRLGRNEEAIELLRRVIALAPATLTSSAPLRQSLRYDLADCLLDLGQDAEVPALLDGLSAETLNAAQPQNDWPGRLAYQRGRLALRTGDRWTAIQQLTTALLVITARNPEGPIPPAKIRALIGDAMGMPR